MSYGRGYRGSGGRGGERRGFGRDFAQKPVEVGKEYNVDITEISRQGDGIARVQGYVVFVKNGKLGQKVKIQVNHVGNRFAKADIVAGVEHMP